MTLPVLFHHIRYRQFKASYLTHLCLHIRKEFPTLPSYQRCLEFMPRCCSALAERHKVLAGVAPRGKSSTGWFFGFKLHIVISHVGELLGIKLTAGNMDDRKALSQHDWQLVWQAVC